MILLMNIVKKEAVNTAKKSKSSILVALLTMIFMVAAGFFLYQGALEIMTTRQLRQQLAETEILLSHIKSENVELTEQKEKLEDPDYVKSYARGTYMLSKEGEQIFYLPSDEEINE